MSPPLATRVKVISKFSALYRPIAAFIALDTLAFTLPLELTVISRGKPLPN